VSLPIFIAVLVVICIVALSFSRRGVGSPTVAAPRLVDGFQGSGESSGSYRVVLTDSGPRKIQFIRALRMLTGVGLTEAKNFADHPGSAIESVSNDVGQRIVTELQAAGATVQLRGPDDKR
jgi:large subunit ribosomal protein L7/L12